MRRRDFLTGVGATASVAAADGSVCTATAQRSQRMRRLGLLTLAAGPAHRHEVFETTLRTFGYREGDNLLIERRYAAGRFDRLPALAADLVRANVDVIVTESTPPALAAKQATTVIPIVMATSGDAVRTGLVESLARPGGNVTGMTFAGPELVGKKLELARELRPQMRRIAWFGNAATVPEQISFVELKKTAATVGADAVFIDVRVAESFASGFATMAATGVDAMIVAETTVNLEALDQIIALAAQHDVVAVYGRREFVDAGGVVSHGPDFNDLFRGAAFFVDRIFQGANPADLPVRLPMKFEIVVNLKAARLLGLTIPRSLLVRADAVIK